MLFSALIDRICGVKSFQDVRPGPGTYKILERESYSKYPGLSSIVFDLLKGSEKEPKGQFTMTKLVNTVEVEKVLLALEIICRAGLPHENQRGMIMRVRSHLQSSIWHIRVLAAKAYGLSVSKLKRPIEILGILDLRGLSFNETHGRLLCVLTIYDHNLQESLSNHEGMSLGAYIKLC